ERQLSVALLTNRTWPDCSNHAIKEVRPRCHDAIVEALGSIS
ncbi:MAG: serine hydrolase, partial [Acidobacteria bacterium]